MSTKNATGQQIRQLLKNSGLKASWVAEQARISRSMLQETMAGRRRMAPETLRRVLAVIDARSTEVSTSIQDADYYLGHPRALAEAVINLTERVDRLEKHFGKQPRLVDADANVIPLRPASKGFRRLRLLGDVAAGLAWEPDRQPDEIDVPARLCPQRANEDLAAVRAIGDSMDPTILPGDYLIVERAMLGKHRKGDLVIALIDGADVTVARYAGQGGAASPRLPPGVIRLTKDNPEHGSIVRQHAEHECIVQMQVHAIWRPRCDG